MSTAEDPLIGYKLAGKYLIRCFLREEMLGKVYAATLGEQEISIKVLNPHMVDEQETFARFSREMLATAAIDHPNTVRMLDFGEHRVFHYIVLERIEGRTLESVMALEGPFRTERVLQIAGQIAGGLNAAHSVGIIHRNLSARNILLLDNATGDFVKIRDFGLASLDDGALDDGGQITQAGMLVGSVEYMAPEYIEGHHLDARADLYALGILMYEMFTGKVPFEGTPVQVMSKHVTESPQQLAEVSIEVPPAWLQELIMGLLSKNPDDRVQAAGEITPLIEEHGGRVTLPELVPLSRWDGQRTHSPPPARVKSADDRGVWMVALAAALLLLVSIMSIMLSWYRG